MAFDFKTLSLDSITALPLDVKRMHKEKSKKWEALTKVVIEAWLKNDERYLEVDGIKYKLVKQ